MTIRLLCVDDDEDIRAIARLCLELDGSFEVQTCGSGREALDIAREWMPDLILLDVMMPDMDGPKTRSLLAADPLTATVPVAFLTARAHSQDMALFLSLGVVGVIAKPFDPMRLAPQVRELLDKGGRLRRRQGPGDL